MMRLRQLFARAAALDVAARAREEARRLARGVRPGARIAVAVGSRGITNLRVIVAETVAALKAAGAAPFIIPAMGSHGGATPEGQVALLAEYGVTEATLGVPFESGMDAEPIGATARGIEVPFSTAARRADGIVLINRIKPHTDFSGALGSGLLKMLVIGLGKRAGAAAFHQAAIRFGYEEVLREAARLILQSQRILGGLAVVENQFHDTALLEAVMPAEMERREEQLFVESRNLMPRLPFDEVDLLIVDRLGKNISGAGMDPNVTGRWVHGYSTLLADQVRTRPLVRRLFVRELTPETHGNAVGIGLADLTTTRLARSIDHRITGINSLTALTPNAAKVPIHFETDREAIERALISLGEPDSSRVRVLRILDTLSLELVEASEAYVPSLRDRADLKAETALAPMAFDDAGNLRPLGEA
ncbi:MAG TPA: lactate racemase domain-containing protein [Methylomirabilota bacterium]|nr:lactate racemase domain-containing protein [Methylomirabilota bacterium]